MTLGLPYDQSSISKLVSGGGVCCVNGHVTEETVAPGGERGDLPQLGPVCTELGKVAGAVHGFQLVH